MSFTTRFGVRMTRHTGALELMDDLGNALARPDAADLHMLGGGNPARIEADHLPGAFGDTTPDIDLVHGRFSWVPVAWVRTAWMKSV